MELKECAIIMIYIRVCSIETTVESGHMHG